MKNSQNAVLYDNYKDNVIFNECKLKIPKVGIFEDSESSSQKSVSNIESPADVIGDTDMDVEHTPDEMNLDCASSSAQQISWDQYRVPDNHESYSSPNCYRSSNRKPRETLNSMDLEEWFSEFRDDDWQVAMRGTLIMVIIGLGDSQSNQFISFNDLMGWYTKQGRFCIPYIQTLILQVKKDLRLLENSSQDMNQKLVLRIQ